MNDSAAVNQQHFSRFVTLTWDDYVEFLKAATEVLKGKRYDSIYGVPRGGLMIAVPLSHALSIPFTLTPFEDRKQGKSVLVCDDIADTGETLKRFKGFDMLTWVVKPRSVIKPNFSFLEVEDDEWVVFPWESAKRVER